MVTTHAMHKMQGPLLVNADASSGSLVAELLDVDGNPIPGYTANDCLPIKTDGIAQVIKWSGHAELPDSGKLFRIRFLITRASLFGFYAGPEIISDDD